jgi:hypothetical protein
MTYTLLLISSFNGGEIFEAERNLDTLPLRLLIFIAVFSDMYGSVLLVHKIIKWQQSG